MPHVISAHSLEPKRPWKAEQLGGGYRLSSWIEKTAYEGADRIIAVSHGMRGDVLESYPNVDPAKVDVVHNGIDTELYQPDPNTDLIESVGIDPSRPYVLFVGRITRQKGIAHLLKAAAPHGPGHPAGPDRVVPGHPRARCRGGGRRGRAERAARARPTWCGSTST